MTININAPTQAFVYIKCPTTEKKHVSFVTINYPRAINCINSDTWIAMNEQCRAFRKDSDAKGERNGVTKRTWPPAISKPNDRISCPIN